MRFTKMHGCGNDYVYIDTWHQPEIARCADHQLAGLAREVSDRHRGIGADGLILVGPDPSSEQPSMRMFNADGSESEMCGNGLRCAVRLAWDHGHLSSRENAFVTGAGLLDTVIAPSGEQVSVNMGRPRLNPNDIPVKLEQHGPLELSVLGQNLTLFPVGMGNPHAVCFVDDAEDFPVREIGPILEHHEVFPARANIEFVSPLVAEADRRWRQRTWERGSGETQACGTGACAVAVAAILTQRADPGSQTIVLNGGELIITWSGKVDDSVIMDGPATTVFAGEYPFQA